MAERLREAQAALRGAENAQQREDVLRELRRLRDEQVEAMRDVDELQQRMESPENRQRMADARQQLDDSRSEIRQSTEELEQGMVARAITSTTRAGRQLDDMRDEFRRQTSSQFGEAMQDLREEARQLDQRQQKIAEAIEQQIKSHQKTLSGSDGNIELVEEIDQQRVHMRELIEQMRDLSERSEDSEPLLSRKLYNTLRQASTENVDRTLETARELLQRNFLPQAQEVERQAGEGIEAVRKGVEEAARNVLGDEAESLRLARQRIDELVRQVEQEVAQARPENEERSNQRQSQPPGGPRQQGSPMGPGGNQVDSGHWEDVGARGPLTGQDYREWSDDLRDIEEMLTERELRDEVARVRDRARGMRTEFVRHGTEPQWDLVRSQITEPLAELTKQIGERLAQLQSDEAMVPIDRDPVPDRFAEVVRKYFENLGGND